MRLRRPGSSGAGPSQPFLRVLRWRSDAREAKQRWRMIFDQSPLPQICFNAAPLHDLLQRRTACGAERLGDVMSAQLDSVVDIFRHTALIEANEAAAALFGGQALWRDFHRVRFAESFLTGFCCSLNDIGEDGVMPPFETRLIRADGAEVDVQVHQRMSPGQSPGWRVCVASYVDMTEARRAVRAQHAALEARDAANRAKSNFLAVIDHEIRTPLNGVLGMAQAMDRDPLPSTQRDRLNVIRESGASLMRLLNELIDLSRIEGGKLELDASPIDLKTIVQGAHAAFAPTAARKGLQLRLFVQPEAEGLYIGDAERVRQIIDHLLSNALKFTIAGGVSVHLKTAADGVACEVSDTGVGIAPEQMGDLFDKFVQADASATRAFGGAGLGLALCQHLARAMGGAVLAESQLGVGSRFTAHLPLRRSAASPDESQSIAASLAGGGAMRILAAEDNEVNRLVLRTLLAQVGLNPVMVENGAEAVSAWEAAQWDLILMDIQMPVMDGRGAVERIRAREAELGRAPTPILALTANTMAHQAASYRAIGMDGVLSKPINVAELLTAIAAVAAAQPRFQAPRPAQRSATGVVWGHNDLAAGAAA